MKKNDIKDLHEQDIEGLTKRLDELVKSFDQARSENAAGKLKNTSSLYQIKKDIARVKTVMQEKMLVVTLQEASEDKEN